MIFIPTDQTYPMNFTQWLISVWEKEFLSAVDNLTVPEGLEIFKFAQRSFKDTAGASIRVSIIQCNWILRVIV